MIQYSRMRILFKWIGWPSVEYVLSPPVCLLPGWKSTVKKEKRLHPISGHPIETIPTHTVSSQKVRYNTTD